MTIFTTYKKQLDFNFKRSEDMESLGKEAQKQTEINDSMRLASIEALSSIFDFINNNEDIKAPAILVKITDEIVKRGAYNLNIRIDTKEIL